MEVGANYARQEWGQDMMLWSEFLDHCGWDEPAKTNSSSTSHESEPESSPNCPPILYMAQHDLAAQFPALENDYILPDYVYTSPSAPPDWPGYKPPATPSGVISNLWIGPAGTVSPPHHDSYYNCFVQVVGHKEIWVAPPHCRPIAHKETTTSIAESFMANTADIDVFGSVEAVSKSVRASASKAVLGPGDLLFMPPGWWHSLRSLSRSFSVSLWF